MVVGNIPVINILIEFRRNLFPVVLFSELKACVAILKQCVVL